MQKSKSDKIYEGFKNFMGPVFLGMILGAWIQAENSTPKEMTITTVPMFDKALEQCNNLGRGEEGRKCLQTAFQVFGKQKEIK